MPRRRRQLAGVKVRLDRERLREMRNDPGPARQTAKALNAAACAIIRRGDGFGPRKAFLSDVAAQVGVPMRRLAPIAAQLNNLGLVVLARADLVGAMDPARVAASEIELEPSGARFNFLEVDDC